MPLTASIPIVILTVLVPAWALFRATRIDPRAPKIPCTMPGDGARVVPEIVRLRRFVIVWSIVLMVFGVVVLVFVPFGRDSRIRPSFGAFASGLYGPLFLYVRSRRMFHPSTAALDLTSEGQSMAEKLGRRLHEVRIVDSDYGKKYAAAIIRKTRGQYTALLTARLVEVSGMDEVRGVVAHEVAHLAARAKWSPRGVVAPAFMLLFAQLVLMVVMLYHGIHAPVTAIVLVYTLPIIGIAIQFKYHIPVDRWNESECDRIALWLTGDLGAMERGLTNTAKYSQSPKMHQKDGWTHPSIPKRIRMLREAARDLGLDGAGME